MDKKIGYVYKITCNVSNKCYIGSTIQSLDTRLKAHIRDYKYYMNGHKKYCTSFVVLENDNYSIDSLAVVNYVNKSELLGVEGYFMTKYECVNKNLAGNCLQYTSMLEYYSQYNKARSQSYRCPCGGKFIHHVKYMHLKTKKHQQYLSLAM